MRLRSFRWSEEAEMEDVCSFLAAQSRDGLLSQEALGQAVEQSGLSWARIERLALERNLLPARYQRNRNMLTLADQLRLAESRVAVIGCGGLGGYILEELGRLGVGRIVAIDPDVFDEHNLNRQLLATPALLGTPKVDVAKKRLREINPAVEVITHQKAFGRNNGMELLSESTVAVDALDNIEGRLELAEISSALGITMVHGAIAGWYGQVTTQFPGERTVQENYPQNGRGIEKELGNPSFTPAVIASLQAAEVCKVLLGRGTPLRGRTLIVDLLEMEFVETQSRDTPPTA